MNKIIYLVLPFLIPFVLSIQKSCRFPYSSQANHHQQTSNQTTFFRQIFGINSSANSVKAVQKCPQHSYCNSKHYCQCEPGYILNCQIPSNQLDYHSQIFTFHKNTRQYFNVIPSNHYRKSFFQISICVGEPMLQKQTQLLFDIRVYGDIGLYEDINEDIKIMNATFQVAGIQQNKCYYIRSFPLVFGDKVNGETQQLIMTIQLMNHSQYLSLYPKEKLQNLSTIITNQSKPFETVEGSEIITKKLRLAVYQYQYYDAESMYISKIITLSMLLFSGVISLITILLLWYRLRRFGPAERRRHRINDLTHFEEYLPSCVLDNNSLQIGQICSICLIEFQDHDKIRKTHCNHLYHSDCLDSWCKDKLKCPLCRGCLSKKTLKHHKQELESNKQNKDQQSQSSLSTVNIQNKDDNSQEKQKKQILINRLREDD